MKAEDPLAACPACGWRVAADSAAAADDIGVAVDQTTDEFVVLGQRLGRLHSCPTAGRTSMSAHDPRCWCSEISATVAALPEPIIGSTSDPACCGWCGRVGGAPYCSSAHAAADKAAAE